MERNMDFEGEAHGKDVLLCTDFSRPFEQDTPTFNTHTNENTHITTPSAFPDAGFVSQRVMQSTGECILKAACP